MAETGMDLVSVILPTFNRAYCLPRAIDSVLAQTHQNVEIVLVDDGSTDNTRAVLRGRYGDDPRIRYIYRENAGVTAARNRALKEARGDFVALLDSDDVWMPWKLELQLACLEAAPQAGMVWSDMAAVGPEGEIVDEAYLRTMYEAYRWFPKDALFDSAQPLRSVAPRLADVVGERSLYAGDVFSPMFMGNLVHTSTALLRRERLEQVKQFNPELKRSGEDYDFHFRTSRAGPVAFVDVATIRYQTGMPDRLTRAEFKAETAINCLMTIQPVYVNDRKRLALPAPMIRARMAEVHDWVGETLFDIGEFHESRKHLCASLHFKKWQPRTARLLMLTLMPPGITARCRQTYRRFKTVFGAAR